ncbi:uncharacterized protein [Halyomorpha halys]|uniref:uncharacterized protein isoform X2 n=1 Tax=Halyomorpha halys TaxID=286706 RepID=UPI0006D4DE86|nr:uncharacterized protein LOC106681930 isoform X2 [Halyomorpha halys]
MSVSVSVFARLLFCSLACFPQGILSLELTELKVPRHANFGETVTLECLFELDRGSLYSVKWYKDEDEFFRYMPDSSPRKRVFILPGVSLNADKSNMSQVTLNRVGFTSSGSYRCEVSTEAPDFETALQSKNMTVVVYPDGPPVISGVPSTYSSAEEHITANCTSGKSNPAPVVIWYVNGVKMSNQYTMDGAETESQGPVYSRSSQLRYPLSRVDAGYVNLNCSSFVAALPPLSTVLTVRVSSASAKPAKQRLHNSGTKLSGWALVLLPSLLAVS